MKSTRTLRALHAYARNSRGLVLPLLGYFLTTPDVETAKLYDYPAHSLAVNTQQVQASSFLTASGSSKRQDGTLFYDELYCLVANEDGSTILGGMIHNLDWASVVLLRLGADGTLLWSWEVRRPTIKPISRIPEHYLRAISLFEG